MAHDQILPVDEDVRQFDAYVRATLERERRSRQELEAKLAEAEAARLAAEEQRDSELASAAARLSESQAQHQISLARAARVCTGLQQRLLELEGAVRNADERRTSESAASADHLTQRHAEFTASLAQAARARDALAQKLSATLTTLEESQQARAAEAAAAADHLARRERELHAALDEAAAAKAAVESALAETSAAYERDRERAAADLAAAAERQEALDAQLRSETAARAGVEQSLEAAETARCEAEARQAAELASASARLAEIQAQHEASLAEAVAARTAFERKLAEAATAFQAQLEQQRTRSERSLAAKQEEVRDLERERGTLQGQLATSRDQLEQLHTIVNEEREAYEQARAASEAELQRLSAEYEKVRQSLDQLRAAFDTLERIASEHAIERARLEGLMAERDEQLSADAARHLAAQHAADEALAQLEERRRTEHEASSGEIARLHREAETLRRELDLARRHADALRADAGQVPVLRRQLEEGRKENRRQFERAPYGLCRCEQDGAIILANHSLVRLLGYRRSDDLRSLDFAATVFESPADYAWLIERAISTGRTEALEATWKTKDGRRLLVRLQALAAASGTVEIVVEDLTALRSTEERLRQAQRMEAVGRLASEVAETCDTLLRDVTHGGQQWLAAFDSDTSLRHQGEALLGEVTRAAGYLRQFADYGNKQVSALEPVSLARVLRDLELVLKRVAGDDIELLLPKASSSFDVDVDAERVERILVNVASYARSRMPHGGRVKVELATTVVGRRFLASYPSVRPGEHVLITVTEIPGSARPVLPVDLRPASEPPEPVQTPARQGLDLGTLLSLIGDCGGHLWMAAEPSGNMVVKIHLPKRVPLEAAEAAPPVVRTDRGRALGRWFRH
ncbi:MAG TPA: PAS domain S-box protein [Vicinamibacterales bacterium]|nr:PAS domain S-box protein [Vicinamibacterales bacterium]